MQVVTQREPAGAQRVAHQLCQALRADGVESEVVFLYRRADAFADEGYVDLRPDRPGPFGTLALVARLSRLLRRQRPTALIAHTFHAIVVASLAGLLAGVPRRIAVHHVVADFESPLRRAVLRVVRRTPLVGVHVYVSQSTLDSYGPAARRGAVVIHNGIDVSAPAHADSGGWASDPRSDPTRPLVVAVGRLAEQKDHRTLLAAMVELPEVDLAILGEGDLRTELSRQVDDTGLANRVTMVGNVSPEEVGAALRAADVVVQPSLWEAFSMVVLEAMAAGRPLVVSDIPAHREALGDQALFHEVGDAAGLAKAIRSLIADPDRRTELGAGAQRLAAGFDHAEVARRYLALARSGPSPRRSL